MIGTDAAANPASTKGLRNVMNHEVIANGDGSIEGGEGTFQF
jgi:hypothetical protein